MTSTSLRSDFLQAALARGYMHQCTDMEALDARLRKGPVTAYVGFDCTGPSLHVGHLLSIMLLRLFQKTGHRPIALMGGGTTKIGDPSFRDEARPLLDDAVIAENKRSIQGAFDRFMRFGQGPADAVMVDNAEWLDGLAYIPFLREVGRHFSINRMLTFDSVKLRLEREQPLTFLEFNYMILQSYDFVELARRYGCTLQMGGSDQWGNIVSGVELGRRLDDRELFGLTTPLLTTSSGAKMGKTAKGAVWLNKDQLNSYGYSQFWRDTDDADVGRFLRLFTELPLDEIARLEALEGAERNEAKRVLALEATTLAHGAEAALQAEAVSASMFSGATVSLTVSEAFVPTRDVSKTALQEGVRVSTLLHETGLCSSLSEARKLIRNGGARINDEKFLDEMRVVSFDDINSDGRIKLSAGRKKHALVRVT